MIVEFRAASFWEGDVQILKNLNFTADEHRIGIVGRNGSGKSTLARMLCGLIAPTAGTVRIDGFNVFEDRRYAIQTVGMLFQNPDHQIIFPTVEEELAFGLLQLGVSRANAKAKVMAALEQFGAKHWATRSVSVLSQGQRHLVCLMAVLLMEPRLVVLDEPYAGLDIPTTMQLSEHLRVIDAMIIHISHEPGTFEDFDRVLWLESGEIVADDSPRIVLPEFTKRMRAIGSSDALV